MASDSGIAQLVTEPTWGFPLADFTSQPYFAAEATTVDITAAGTQIPIHGFGLEGSRP